MTHASDEGPALTRRYSCAAIKLWGSDDAREALAVVGARVGGHPGVFTLAADLFAVAPVAGDPAVFDAALSWTTRLLAGPGGADGEASAQLRALLFPAVLLQERTAVELAPDSLVTDLERRTPDLLGSGVFLSGRAVTLLEIPHAVDEAGGYLGPSGSRVPLFRAGPPAADAPPWRNREILGRRPPPVARPTLERRCDALLESPAARVTGGIGTGKTRLAWERLALAEVQRLWLTVRPRRAPRPSLTEQIVDHLVAPSSSQVADPRHPAKSTGLRDGDLRRRLDGWQHRLSDPGPDEGTELALRLLERILPASDAPVWLVIDDLHQAHGEDAELVDALLESPQLGSRFRLLLLGRSEAEPSRVTRLPTLEVGPLEEAEMEELSTHLVAGLSLPDEVRRRFLEAAQGHPFAFEEGLLSLIHHRSLRRVYGSFFFSGDRTADFRPSGRLTRHAEAETGRLAPLLPARLLAAAATPLPAAAAARAAECFGEPADEGWERPLLTTGLLRSAATPWGVGVEVSSPALAAALAASLPPDAVEAARQRLGVTLAEGSEDGQALWEAYRLLQGSAEAAATLLRVTRSSFARTLPREELVETLAAELKRLRERPVAPATELELLWSFLPLARRVGRLHLYEAEVSRAVELAVGEPARLLALASLKAEMEGEAGRFQEAEATIQEALRLARGSDQRRQAMLLIQLARLLVRQDRVSEGAALLRNLMTALDRSGSSAMAAACRFHLGNLALQQGRLEEALELHQAALAERQRQQLKRPVGTSLSALGAVSIALGNYPRAIRCFVEARNLLEEHGREGEVSFALLGLARAYSRLGDFTAAAQPVRRALALRQGRDDVAGEAVARLAAANNFLHLGQPDSALREARQAHFQFSLMSAERHLADAEELLGRICFRQRNFAEARRRLEAALETHRRLDDALAVGFDLAWLLETEIALELEEEVSARAAELEEVLRRLQDPELGEILHFRLYRALDWLAARGRRQGDPLPWLERAYRRVLRKAGHLDPEQRHSFLFQVPHNRDILDAAGRRGLAIGEDGG